MEDQIGEIIPPMNEEKDVWRNIFFSISQRTSQKKLVKNIEGRRTAHMEGDTPEIDIKRLVDFLHTRDISSKKVTIEGFSLSLTM